MAWWAFQNVVVTAALALVVAMICRAPRLNPVVRHALWVVVLIKFITPPLMAWPWAVPDPLGIRAVDIRAESVSVGSTSDMAPRVADDRTVPSASAAILPTAIAPAARETRTAASVSFAAMWPWLSALWIFGAIVVLLVECVRLLKVARAVRGGTSADPAIIERVRVFANRLGVKPIPVVALRETVAPAVWCLGQPRLLWPAELPIEFTDACIDGLIVHELAHVKRRDHIVGWIELAASVVWWWNPLFWYVRSAMREQAELACDGWVVAALPNGRRAYAESLLALSSSVTAPEASASPIAAVLGVRARSRRALERRLVMIMKGRASRQLSAFGLVGLVVMAAATLPVWAAGSQQQPPPPPSASQVIPVPPPPPPAPSVPVPVMSTTSSTVPQAPVPVMGTMATSVPQQVPPPPPPAPRAPTQAPPPPPPPPAAPSASGVATTVAPSARYAPSVAVQGGVVRGQLPATAIQSAPTAAVRGERLATTQIAPTMQGGQTPRPAVVTRGEAQGAVAAPTALVVRRGNRDSLPADGQEIVKKFETQRDAIEMEADRKVTAEREAVIKSLTALQEQYTKAGKLDEAVAIRDYIRTLSNGRDLQRTVIRR